MSLERDETAEKPKDVTVAITMPLLDKDETAEKPNDVTVAITMPLLDEENPQIDLSSPPVLSPSDRLRRYIATHPYIYELFTIFCGIAAAVTFVGTDCFASLAEKFGGVKAMQVLIATTMVWPALVIYASNLRGLVTKDGWKSNSLWLWDMLFSMPVMLGLVLLYEAVGSAFLVLWLIGCFLGLLDVSGLSSWLSAFVIFLGWNNVSVEAWPNGFAFYLVLVANFLAMAFVIWVHE